MTNPYGNPPQGNQNPQPNMGNITNTGSGNINFYFNQPADQQPQNHAPQQAAPNQYAQPQAMPPVQPVPELSFAQKPKRRHKIFAWLGVIFGLTMILGGGTQGYTPSETLGSVLTGMGMFIPAAWWFYCSSKDRKAAQQYQDSLIANQQLASMLGDSAPEVTAGMNLLTPPRRKDRKWIVVAPVSIVLLMVGASMLPESDTTTTEVGNTQQIEQGESN